MLTLLKCVSRIVDAKNFGECEDKISCLGNIIWFVFGGLISAILWFLSGILLCITIIGIPFGKQCFKMARLQLAPFGTKVEYSSELRVGRVLGNIIWLVLFGWELFLCNILSMLLFAITIVGLPFAMQSWKMAKLSLWPFGSTIE